MYISISLIVIIGLMIAGIQPNLFLPFMVIAAIIDKDKITKVFRVLWNMNGGVGKSRYFKMLVAYSALMGAGSVAAYLQWKRFPNTLVFFWALGATWLFWKAVTYSKPQQANNRDQVLRGSSVIDGSTLQRIIWGNKPSDDWQIEIGGVRIPYNFEGQHFLFSGTTGSGKTQALNKVLRVIRLRGKRAMISDSGGGFISRFYRPGDIIFNPFDKRCVPWSPFAEIRAEYDCQRIAKAAIPDGSGDSQEWHNYAQTLLGEVLLALFKRGQHSMKQLLHYVSVANAAELAELLTGTPGVILCQRGNEKMLSNTRGIIATYLSSWRYLPDRGNFSVRRWIQDESHESWFFISYRDDQMRMLKTLVATMLELGIVEGLSLKENPERGLWFVLDEVDSLGKVSSLGAGLTRGRKYGNNFICALQTISQMRATYGHDEAQTLLANFSTKLVLRAGDNQTAEYFSKEFGQQEIERRQITHSQGNSNSPGGGFFSNNQGSSSVSSNTSVNQVRETKATILPSEIMSLNNLTGYLRIPACPIAHVLIQHEALPEVAYSFEENEIASVRPTTDAIFE